ncbi:hypothetical protein VNO77_02637 [Canavalia gladiata]|uniref:Uncharacterized protein n=1 Tax=Canavalia gladiata TaxID=3824 RepID=A0AAN9MTJ7_CANGL
MKSFSGTKGEEVGNWNSMETLRQKPQNLKRKLEQDFTEDQRNCKKIPYISSQQSLVDFNAEVLQEVYLLNSSSYPKAIKKAVDALGEYAQNEDNMDSLIKCGVVPALVRHLEGPCFLEDDANNVIQSYEFEVEKGCAFVLRLLAITQEHRQLIVDAGALFCLVNLLKRHKISAISHPLIDLLRRVADAITNLAHENTSIKTFVRMEDGIPPLVELLEFNDTNTKGSCKGLANSCI